MTDHVQRERNLKVYVRLRSDRSVSSPTIFRKLSSNDLVCEEPGQPPVDVHVDGVFADSASQRDLFDEVFTPLLESCIANRSDACAILYGDKSSGKSFTLFGEGHADSRGVV